MDSIYFDFYFFKSLINSNDKIKEINISIKKKSNLALFTKEQKDGRGRKKRTWISHPGDLTCSFLINKKIHGKEIGKINILVATCLLSVFEKIGIKKQLSFKWPNDILVSKKKIAGILIETNISKSYLNQFIIGIGVNFIPKTNQKKFSSTSISKFKKKIDSLDFFFLFAHGLAIYFNNYEKIKFDILSENLSNIFFRKRSMITIERGSVKSTGFFEKINEDGELLIKTKEGTSIINYGEII